MHDLKMMDQVPWHANYGPSKSLGVKMQDTEIRGPEIAGIFRVQFSKSDH